MVDRLHEETIKRLEELDFTPKNSYLAKNDPVPFATSRA
jgi:hypothetical protein